MPGLGDVLGIDVGRRDGRELLALPLV